MMNFSEIIAAIRPENDRLHLDIPDDWRQGRTVFGAVQAALGLKAMRELLPDSIPLRTLQTTFIAPIIGKTVQAQAITLRTGKFTSHIEARLESAHKLIAVMLGIFGESRSSEISFSPRPFKIKAQKRLTPPFVPGVTPNFYQHFAGTWTNGGLPFSGSPAAQTIIELSMLEPGPATESHILAMADFVPPLALSMLNRPAAGSSISWMLEFLQPQPTNLSLQKWRIEVELNAASGAYTSQSASIWGPDRTSMALRRQSMVIFE